MPNFGLKCFLGSFIFSLLAVFAVTRGYFVLTQDNQKNSVNEQASVQNIELFAQNEENDKIYEKFKRLSSPAQVQMPISENQIEENVQNIDEEYDDISDTLAFDGEQVGDIIYNPDDEENINVSPSIDGSQTKTPNRNNRNIETDDSERQLALKDDEDEVLSITDDYNDYEDDEELHIADASEAPRFIIPLKHNFGTSSIGGTSVSTQFEDNPTAHASQNVDIRPQSEAASTDIFDDPWETVAVSNRYITKNKMAEFTDEHKDDVAALDKDKNTEVQAENETKVAYKMVKNILIPIPDEIMNDENLTPQLSYSDKNKKIDANLKNKKNARERQLKEREEAAKKKEKIDDEQSKSLTESITNWFSEGKDKEKVNIVTEETKNSKQTAKKDSYSDDDEEESAFSKLLGLRKKKSGNSIIPSELKLSFQPNRAEISGQTLEWLHAFSQNAVKDSDVMVEIRIDGSGSYELQQKRLNLLYTIFANNGVNYDKINIIFTARDPNSFIIRNVKYAENKNIEKPEIKKVGPWY